MSGERNNAFCSGNSFQEPGAFHYLPGSVEIPMSFNGCKDLGCVRYGMKKVQVSPRLSYLKAVEKFLMFHQADRNNSRWIVRNFDPSLKKKLNGKMASGVKTLQRRWFDVIKCLKLTSNISAILKLRRSRMMEAAKLYCINREYCGGRKST